MAATIGFGVVLAAALAVLAREVWCHWYYPLRGRLYLRWDHPELAAAAWERYLQLRTLLGRTRKRAARFTLCHCYYRTACWQEALDQCDAILSGGQADRLAGMALQIRADCLDRLGRCSQAKEARSEAREMLEAHGGDSLFARLLEVDRLEHSVDPFAALEPMELLVEHALAGEVGEEELALRLRLGRLRLRLGHYEGAREAAEGVLRRAGLSTELQHQAHHLAARAYLELERVEQAARDAEAAFRIANVAYDRSRLIDDCLLLAEVALHRGDYVEGMRQYQRVRECGDHGRWMAAVGEAEFLHLWGRDAEAEQALRLARRHADAPTCEEESAQLVIDLAHAAMVYRDDPDRAAEMLAPHRRTPIREPRLAVRRDAVAAVVLAAQGRTDAADRHREALQTARERFAHDRHLLVELDAAEAELHRREGDLAGATERLRAALARPPYAVLVPSLQLRLADALGALGDVSGTRAALERAAEHPADLGAVVEARERLELMPPREELRASAD